MFRLTGSLRRFPIGRFSSNYVLAIETPEGLKPAEFFDLDPNPGIFADATVKSCPSLVKVEAIRNVLASDVIGQIMLSDQLIDLGKDIRSGKVVIKDPDTYGKSKGKKLNREAKAKAAEKIPYYELSEEVRSMSLAQLKETTVTFDVVENDQGGKRAINIRVSMGTLKTGAKRGRRFNNTARQGRQRNAQE